VNKIYTERKILVGALIGGALAGGYFVWRTFKTLGRPAHARATIIVTIIVALLSFGLILTVDSIPSYFIPALHLGITFGVIQGYLSESIHAYLAASKPVYGWTNTILISIAAAAVSVGVIVLPTLLVPGAEPITKYYGDLRHEIKYDPENLSEIEIDRLAGSLTQAGYFDEVQPKTIDASKSGERYVLNLYCNETIRTDPQAKTPFEELRSDVQRSFPHNPIVFDLVIGTPENRVTRLE